MDGRHLRVASHSSELGEWTTTHAHPHPALRPHVLRYLGYTERTTFQRRREVPWGGVVLIINLGPPLALVDPREPASARSFPHGFVAGLSDAVAVTDSGGESAGIQVDFSPVGGRLFLGRPLREVTNRTVTLKDVLGPAGRVLTDRLRETPGWTERFALLDGFLGARFESAPGVPPDLVWVWRRLARSSGRLAVSDLAVELGCSRKHLTGRFGTELGLPPKTMARILRFNAVVGALAETAGCSLAEIAQRCGYYDQAHLNRDFREFAGITPTEHLRRALPDSGGIVGD